MPRLSPSREKLLRAKRFSRGLAKLLGHDLKAVFVVGSVAQNLALPMSDIDVIVIVDEHGGKTTPKVNSALRNPKICPPNFQCWKESPEHFEKVESMEALERNTLFNTAKIFLKQGAVPVYGKDYALQHKKSWGYPSLATIKNQYRRWDVSRLGGSIWQRLKFKRKGLHRFKRP